MRLTRTFGPRPPAPPLARRQRRRGLLVTAAVLVALVASGGAVAASVLEPAPEPAAPPRPCAAVPRPDAPAGAVVVGGDPDGDGCDGWAVYDGRVLSVTLNPADLEPHRYQVGRPGDILLLGDWDCDGVDTPGLYRSRTGEVLLFDDWDATGAGLPPSAVAFASRDGSATVENHGGCDEVVVQPNHA